jgi:hypothetical protein
MHWLTATEIAARVGRSRQSLLCRLQATECATRSLS